MRNVFGSTLVAFGALALAVPAAAQFGGPPPPPNTGVPIYAQLSGGDGSGNITVVIDPPKGTACYIMNLQGIEDATAAHIRTGGPGETGRPVLTLETPQGGTAGGCLNIAADVAASLLGNPRAYTAEVRTKAFPNGAIRGALKS
jgi:Rieske Fe-S protein